MNTQNLSQPVFKDVKVNLRLKLATLWASLMSIFIYVDYFHLYMPGELTSIQSGRVFVFDITQGFLMATLFSMTIPALMIFLSVALTAKASRLANIFSAVIFIPYTLFNLEGVAWIHMYFAAAVEVILLCLIIRYAWKWPRVEA